MVLTYETMSPTIVWQIFIDARSFFSHQGPGRVESPLSLLVSMWWIVNCAIKIARNCPKDQLLGGQQRNCHHQLPPVISPASFIRSRPACLYVPTGIPTITPQESNACEHEADPGTLVRNAKISGPAT
jgi:hypothetical protein